MSIVTATLLSDGKIMDPYYEVLSITITREINRIPWAQVVLLDGDAAKQEFTISRSGFFALGQSVEIRLRYEGEKDVSVFKGIILKQRLENGLEGSRLTLEFKNTTFNMTHQQRSQVFYQKTDADIIVELLKAHQINQGKITTTTTKHAEIVQYACTDWDFLSMRADANSLLLVVEDETVSAQILDLTAQPKHIFEYGISNLYNFEIEADASYQYDKVEGLAWNRAEQKMTAAASATDITLTQGDLKGSTLAKEWQKTPQQLRTSTACQPSELKAWAQSSLQKARLSLLRGRLSSPGIIDIALLDMLEISGIAPHFNGKTVVTGIRHQVDSNGWQTDVQFGLSATGFSEKYEVSETVAAGLVPAINGLQIGVVDSFEKDPEGQFRLKVILPTIDEKTATIWARLAVPDGGKERGFFFPPEKGDEVILGFLNDDPREAIILGSLFSAKNKAPKGLIFTKDNVEKAIVSRSGAMLGFTDDKKASVFIETPNGNTLFISDEIEGISLEDQHGNELLLDANGIQLKSIKDITLNAKDNVIITGKKVEIK
jgi:Rhs element Vgr protein